MTGEAQQAPGVVKVRLSGQPADIDRIAALLVHNGVEVLDTSGPRPNRYDPGERIYLTVRIAPGAPAPARQDLRASALAQRMTRKRYPVTPELDREDQ